MVKGGLLVIPYSEILFFIGQAIYLIRLVHQTKSSKEKGHSINTNTYWSITIIATIMMALGAILINSLVLTTSGIFTVVYSFYHIRINQRSKKSKLSRSEK